MKMLSECEEYVRYIKRYKKDQRTMLKRVSYEKDPLLDVLEEDSCALSESKSRSVWCLHSDNSYLQRTISGRSKHKVFSEALIKTYPSEKLKREVMKCLDAVLDEWQLKAEVEVDGKLHNLIDFYYIEDNCAEVNGKRTAANVQLVIPIKDPAATGKSQKDFEKWVGDNIVFPFHWFGYDFVQLDVQDCSQDVFCDGKIQSWVSLAVMYFEARYVDVTFQKQRFMYHLTVASKFSKIDKQGLCTKSSSKLFNYSDRAYLFNTMDVEKMLQYAQEPGKTSQTSSDTADREWLAIQVDTSKIPSLKLYADTNDDGFNWTKPDAVFTYQSIPRGAITKMKTFDLDEWWEFVEKRRRSGQANP